jgi:hypothetical protein
MVIRMMRAFRQKYLSCPYNKELYNGSVEIRRKTTMATVVVNQIPDALYEKLKQAARLHRRSISREIVACIERAMDDQPIDLERTLARAQELRTKTLACPISDDAFTEAKVAGRI